MFIIPGTGGSNYDGGSGCDAGCGCGCGGSCGCGSSGSSCGCGSDGGSVPPPGKPLYKGGGLGKGGGGPEDDCLGHAPLPADGGVVYCQHHADELESQCVIACPMCGEEEERICGPDVTPHLQALRREVKRGLEKDPSLCWWKGDRHESSNSWDITELAWKKASLNTSDGECPTPPCQGTVTICDECHASANVNYLLLGWLGRYCSFDDGKSLLAENIGLALAYRGQEYPDPYEKDENKEAFTVIGMRRGGDSICDPDTGKLPRAPALRGWRPGEPLPWGVERPDTPVEALCSPCKSKSPVFAGRLCAVLYSQTFGGEDHFWYSCVAPVPELGNSIQAIGEGNHITQEFGIPGKSAPDVVIKPP